MNINRWLREDKGGFGFFLILVIVAAGIYAFETERSSPDLASELTEEEQIAEEEEAIYTRNFNDSIRTVRQQIERPKPDTPMVAQDSVPKQVAITKVVAKTKPKAKPKRKPRRISNEELVRSKLRAGMSVRQIAKATGLEKKYIRSIKKRKECNCP